MYPEFRQSYHFHHHLFSPTNIPCLHLSNRLLISLTFYILVLIPWLYSIHFPNSLFSESYSYHCSWDLAWPDFCCFAAFILPAPVFFSLTLLLPHWSPGVYHMKPESICPWVFMPALSALQNVISPDFCLSHPLQLLLCSNIIWQKAFSDHPLKRVSSIIFWEFCCINTSHLLYTILYHLCYFIILKTILRARVYYFFYWRLENLSKWQKFI
jgi:hypothetical protein